jgi:Lar family restriction alleviation protein
MKESELTEEEILPCPFCGNTTLETEQHQTGQMENILFIAMVKCGKCRTVGPTASCKVNVHDSKWDARKHTRQKAIELWNGRV